jgi:AraC family ethanolamine operon transcriptional activator
LSSVEALLAYAENDSKAMSIRRRYAIYRRALRFAETVDHRISVEEFADALGVSMRVLQLCFRENIGITPRRFLIQMRLNHLHHNLRRRGLDSTSVTRLMQDHGIYEYGRAAGEYKKLFGECPSDTLTTDYHPPERRLLDILNSIAA